MVLIGVDTSGKLVRKRTLGKLVASRYVGSSRESSQGACVAGSTVTTGTTQPVSTTEDRDRVRIATVGRLGKRLTFW